MRGLYRHCTRLLLIVVLSSYPLPAPLAAAAQAGISSADEPPPPPAPLTVAPVADPHLYRTLDQLTSVTDDAGNSTSLKLRIQRDRQPDQQGRSELQLWAAGSARPHTSSSVGGASYVYDANGNLTSGGRTYTWTSDNLPLSVSQTSGSESYCYDADGRRIKVVRGSTSAVYLEGLWEKVVGGSPKAYYCSNRVGKVKTGNLLCRRTHRRSIATATPGALQ